jgi:GNAT superfamily N-acetyltransferase
VNEVRIRAADAADARTIARVHVQAWRESYRGLVPDPVIEALSVERNGAMWTDILAAGDTSIVHVVERLGIGSDEPDLVGFGSAADARGSELGASGEIIAIYLLDRVKRCGIGRRLLSGLLAALAARNHRSAGLWVLVEHHGARRFYETLGARTGTQRIVTGGPVEMHEISYIWNDLSSFVPLGDDQASAFIATRHAR